MPATSKKPPAKAATPAAKALKDVTDALWEWRLEESPVTGTYLGDRRGDDRIDERGPKARERRQAAVAGFRARLDALPSLRAGSEDDLTRRVVSRLLKDEADSYSHAFWEWDVDQLFGLHLLLQNLMSFQPVDDEAAVTKMVARLGQVSEAFRQWEDDLKSGLKSGRVPPRLSVERSIAQLEAFVKTAAKDTAFALPLKKLPRGFTEAKRTSWTKKTMAAVEGHVVPAYKRFLTFLKSKVLPMAREDVGVWSIPGGAEAYAWKVRQMTTTDLTPDQIHAIGQAELAKNKAEMLEIARGQGLKGDLRSVLDAMRKDKRFRLKTKEDILERYRAICHRMDGALGKAFGRIPKADYEIQAIEPWREKDCPAAFYQHPPEDRSRKGIFYANTYDPASWPTYDFEPLCYHEAVPGHHLQVALAQELDGLPKIRRHEGFTSYIEGWAHYTERLADEMGMYSTPWDRIGMLSAQAWRAARLVVDTGMHHLRWTRERAIEVLESIRSGPRIEVENEVDRYIIWPGQALAYKIGSRTITRLREEAKARMKKRFDLKAFHDEVLKHGALPLSILEEVVLRWSSPVA